MKLNDINKTTVKLLDNKELITLHRRVHQLYGLKRNYSVDLKKIHLILSNEITRRGFKHSSDLYNKNTEQKINEEKIMKTSDKLKLLAMEFVFNSDLPAKKKKQDLQFIKEKADPYQCIGYILDGKFYNLNEQGKIELKKRFIEEGKGKAYRKTGFSIYGGAVAPALSAAGNIAAVAGDGGVISVPIYPFYRAIRAAFNKCSGACGMFALNTPKRQICLAKCKVMSLEKGLVDAKRNKASREFILKLQAKLEKAKKKFKDYQDFAKSTGRNPDPKIDPNKKSLFRIPK